MNGVRRWALITGIALSVVLSPTSSAAAPSPQAPSPQAPSPQAPSPGTLQTGAAGFVLPVPQPAVILTAFRPPATRYGTGHRGVDLQIGMGGPVRAAGVGVVVYAGDLAGRGVISIRHPSGLRTTYEPVTALVSLGDPVAPGQLIGTAQAGHPPCAPRVCLHWGARLPDGSYLDPMKLLTGLEVRLLPWRSG